MVDRAKTTTGDGIAVVGMACTFPGAHSPEELWRNVLAGRRHFRRIPPERMPLADYHDPDPAAPLRSYSDQMAVLTGWRFDPVEFRIPPVTFRGSDMAHWLALHTARAALEDAGFGAEGLGAADRSRIGVVLGNSLAGEFTRSQVLTFRWPYVDRAVREALERSGVRGRAAEDVLEAVRHRYLEPLPDVTEDTLAGNMANTIAGRIAGYFDLGGGAYTVDGACSSSLLSVASACNALVAGELDAVLAGGVDVSLDPFELVGFAKTKALARDDIRPYDEGAEGMLPGEGCGLFVLVREEDARASGRPIHAVVRGWGVSSDGSGGITAPRLEGQQRALRRAYDRAGYSLAEVELIEGHGTGTPLGDRVELSAIMGLLEEAPGGGPCWIGSIKGSIGHCKAAAGAAGMVKAIMALKRGVLPPTAGCERPTPVLGRPAGRLRPSLRGGPWERDGAPRRASVSAMGFGGANAHVALEEAEPGTPVAREDLALLGSAQTTELVLLAGRDEADLLDRVREVRALAGRLSRAELTDMAAALAAEADRRCGEGGDGSAFPARVAVVASSPWHLEEALGALVDHLRAKRALGALHHPDVVAGRTLERPRLAALYPGQGSQRPGMGSHLGRRHPSVAAFLEEATEATADLLPRPLRAFLEDDPWATEEERRHAEGALRDTRVAQPALVAVALATLERLRDGGLEPELHLGHSLGEISALAAAGVLTPTEAVRVAALRGRAMAELELPDPGAMVAVAASPDEVERLVAGVAGVVVSGRNGPRQTTASGTTAGIDELLRRCQGAGIVARRLPVSHAFHSPLVEPAAVALAGALGEVSFRTPVGTVVSSCTGMALTPDTELAALLADHVRQPVRFLDAVLQAGEEAPTLWVEVGPGGVLTGLVREILGPEAVVLPTERPGEDGFAALNRVWGTAWVQGMGLRAGRVFSDRWVRPFPLEGWDPLFLVNPCERPVEIRPPVAPASVLGHGLAPEGMEPEAFESYLERRGPFLRDVVAADLAHHGAAPAALVPHGAPSAPPPRDAGSIADGRRPSDTTVPEPEGPASAGSGPAAMVERAIAWIAERTGFPVDAISPEMRLRDDLNLDSIKVGELWLTLARGREGEVTGDPAAMANARIRDLAAALEEGGALAAPGRSGRSAFGAWPEGAAPWVGTFGTGTVEAPLPRVGSPLRPGARVAVVGGGEEPWVATLVEELRKTGLAPWRRELPALGHDGEPRKAGEPGGTEELAEAEALVVVLPRETRSFLEVDGVGFRDRLYPSTEGLFALLRDALRGRPPEQAFPCVVVRPADPGAAGEDLEAGGALLRTLFLETPGVTARWLRIPSGWDADRAAGAVRDELQAPGPSGLFLRDEEGRRFTRVAVPEDEAEVEGEGLVLGEEDVVFATGGGKGITAELMLGLARRGAGRFVLAGSSPPPAPGADPDRDEVARTLGRFSELGVPCRYVQCDVTDPASVQEAVARAEEAMGRITVVVHGAGITRFASIRDKEPEEFRQCLRVKAHGLHHLLRALPPEGLRAVHLVSSVLGWTGMRGQADYTTANAWLDGAARHLAARHPHLHVLALGYSVWEGTGLGDRLGALEFLRSVGVTPLGVEDGVSAYTALCGRRHRPGTVVVTGRLSVDLEAQLYAPPPARSGRFLDRWMRWIPGRELAADATLSLESDPYLAEHVYGGTPLLPGVMAMEAVVQAACALTGREELPTLRDVRFRRPVIVPRGDEVGVRILAHAAPSPEGTARVEVAIRTRDDGFRDDHVTATCVFDAPGGVGTPGGEGTAAAPLFGEPLPVGPDDFAPVPLFQGRFFRRIEAIHHLEPGERAVAAVRVPGGPDDPTGSACFGEGLEADLRTHHPAARDAFLQTGALILPPGTLPRSVGSLRFGRTLRPGELVWCVVDAGPSGILSPGEGGRYRGRYRIFDAAGVLVEEAEDLLMETASSGPGGGQGGGPGGGVPGERGAPPLPSFETLPSVVEAALPGLPHALVVVEHGSLAPGGAPREALAGEEEAVLRARTGARRRPIARANRVAARRAALRFPGRPWDAEAVRDFRVASRSDGKPFLVAGPGGAPLDGAVDLSLADGAGRSLAFLVPGAAGIDLEAVEPRASSLWEGLLGKEGWALARGLAAGGEGEPASGALDRAATRVWTLVEAARKAGAREGVPQILLGREPGGGLAFELRRPEGRYRLLSFLVQGPAGSPVAVAVAVGEGRRVGPPGAEEAEEGSDPIPGRLRRRRA